MAVIADRRPLDDETVAPIVGRPDFSDPTFGVTYATKHPPYVFSIRGVSCLVHDVASVSLHWWRIASGGHRLVKLRRPVMIANTKCAQFFRLEPEIARTCTIPSPLALRCGRCAGRRATFPMRGPARVEGITRHVAHVKLGCVVKGY